MFEIVIYALLIASNTKLLLEHSTDSSRCVKESYQQHPQFCFLEEEKLWVEVT